MKIYLSDPTIGTFVLDENFRDLENPALNRFFSFGVKTPYCFGEVFRKKDEPLVWIALQGQAERVKNLRELAEIHWVTQIYGARIEAS